MILIADDDKTVLLSLSTILKRKGYKTITATSPEEVLEIVRNQSIRLILMDMNYSLITSGEEGLELLQKVKIFCKDTPVILMTAWGSIDLAVSGMRYGAFDFITKPWNNLVLLQRIETAINLNNKEIKENLNENIEDDFDRSLIVGKSKAITEVLQTIKRICKTNASVLVMGESGTGKELIAQTIHINSPRKNKNLVKVNLGGVPSSLFESEMFGHKKGAFTDAYTDHKGYFEQADGGTIFLDEIGETDLNSQVKLLRVLQEHTFRPLGFAEEKKSDFRLVSATNADLEAMVKDKTFREDLFYRINLITVNLPALRERPEDIPLLSRHFLKIAAKQNGFENAELTQSAEIFLAKQPFYGNIRELKNLIERTLLVSGDKILDKEDFMPFIKPISQSFEDNQTLGLTLEENERNKIIKTLEIYQNNLSKTALALGISRAALYRRMEKYGIK